MLAGTGAERVFRRLLEGCLVAPLARAGVVPDHLTAVGLVLSALAGLLALGAPPAAAVALLAAGLLDGLDGSLARATGRASRAGAFLDSTLDRYGEFLVLLGVWGWLARLGWGGWGGLLALAALQGALMVSYTRARAEGLGHGLRGGVFERPERLLVLAAGLLASAGEGRWGLAPGTVLLATLGVLGLGANVTAVRRVLRGRRALAVSEPAPGS
ncbi:MAG: CDP-alcohol phosphatidyltransferase family protein [Deferrisomatales bacterium]|nr:CDP-alcohol phosphatidyltransferase family protein [Deferrisomatales bacterium]